MSIIHNIKPKISLDISVLKSILEKDKNIQFQQRAEDYYFLWVDKKSTKGIDLTIEENNIEIRNTTLSNHYDYFLTNNLIKTIAELTKGKVFNEDNDLVNNFPIFSENEMLKLEESDCKVIMVLSKENEDIAIYGTQRQVHFGFETYKKYKDLIDKPKQLIENVFNVILNVQYHLPNYDYGNIMEVEKSNETKTLKLLTNKTNYIIGKYDYIMFQTNNDPIIITNKILNSILPNEWELVDEFTIVAPIIDEKKWRILIEKASEFDQYSSFLK